MDDVFFGAKIPFVSLKVAETLGDFLPRCL